MSMKTQPVRRERVAAALACALLAACSSAARTASAEPAVRPNLVVFLVDDMGVMDSSVPFLTDENGKPRRYPLNDFYRTPQMERLAERGVRFSQFYAMSVCSPTRVSLATGQNSARHRTTNWINPDSNNRGPSGPLDWNWQGLGKRHVTLARLLQSSGYRTIHVGKGHFGPRGSEGEDPRNLGFDVNVGGASIGAPGSYYGRKRYGADGARRSHAVPHLDKYHDSETFLTDALTLEAEAEVERAVRDGRPFFLNLAHYAVHAPFDSDPRFAANYADSGKPKAAQAFATLIEGMDRSLGRLLDRLESLGVADETLVVFLGDNGSDAPLGGPHETACAAPLRGRKGACYEGGMRAPLIVAWAQPDAGAAVQRRLPVAAGAVQTQLAAVYDLFPTLLDVAGVAPPADHSLDGRTLKPLLEGRPDPQRPRSFLMHYPHSPHRSDYFTVYRRDDWKLIYHYRPEFEGPAEGDPAGKPNKKAGRAGKGGGPRKEPGYELYDLSRDPFETTDRAAELPAEVSRLSREMAAALEAQQAQFPIDADGNPLRPAIVPPSPRRDSTDAEGVPPERGGEKGRG